MPIDKRKRGRSREEIVVTECKHCGEEIGEGTGYARHLKVCPEFDVDW